MAFCRKSFSGRLLLVGCCLLPSFQGLWIDNFDVLMAPVQERRTSVCPRAASSLSGEPAAACAQRQWRVLHCYTFMASEAQGWHRLCREGGFGKLDEGRTQRHADAGEFLQKNWNKKGLDSSMLSPSQRHEEMRESRCMSTYSQQNKNWSQSLPQTGGR
eukprot:s3087_g6.t1